MVASPNVGCLLRLHFLFVVGLVNIFKTFILRDFAIKGIVCVV